MLNELQENVEDIATYVDTWQLRAAIGRARTSMQVTFDRIIEWFHLSREAKREPFTIEDAINISTLSIKALSPEFSSELKISPEMTDFRIQGNLASFVDILFMTFENIVKHSGIANNPTAVIYAEYKENNLTIRVENKLGRDIATPENRAAVENARSTVKQQPYSKSVTREGGTGFYKLQKILFHDFRSGKEDHDPFFDFGFIDNDIFFVEIQIPILYMNIMEDK
jgi:hypothetical protein